VARRALAIAAAATLTACAPDSWRHAPTFDEFLRRISQECHPNSIGKMQISNLTSDPFFINQTSRLYHKSISPRQYVTALNGFFPGNNAAALDCILARVPRGGSGEPPAAGSG
jgi:hypothetical protein